MLTESIMHDCIIKLIKSNDEESFECLCKLLTTIGKDLDHPKAKPRMDQYFEQMKKIIVQKKTSSRCRFMLQDVVDLRSNNWVPRRDENNPKTIDQIHKEVAEEEKKTMIAIQQSRQQKRDNPNKGRDSPRPSGVPQADETWTTVPGRTRNVNVDPKKFQDAKKRTNVDTESISLGPGGRGPGAWARGSSGGVGPSAVPGTQNTEQESRGNRFSALGSEGRRGPGTSRQGSGAGRQDARNQGPPGRRPMHDREKALEAVRNVVQTKPRQEDRDTGSPRLEEVEPVKTPTPPPPSVSPPVKQLSDEDIRHKAIGLADEYFGIKDLKEAKYCVEELDPSTHQQLVYHCLNHCLEKHSSERLAIAKMMFYLRKNDIISEENYINGLKQLLEFAEDMEIDIPHVWKYFGELIGPLILDNVLSLHLLSDCIVSLIQDKTKQAKLLAEILLNASKESSPGEVGSIWSKSGLSFSIFFSSNDEAKEFIKDKNLDSIVSSGSHASNVQEELRNLILTKKVSNEDVFKWVDGNVSNPKEPKFIRALVTAVCEGCRKGTPSGSEDSCDVDLFRQRIPLLKKYIDDNSSLELQALFALQALAVQLDQPPDFLKSFFNTLYDEDLITEDAFFTWETNSDPQEAQGKGTALSSTVHFFEWLRSAEEEKNEEG
ncbi:eukaryotic translation initiation factor 4 gamma 1 [Exaiptasia diaphana]|uniref:Eukaryotic translation initiation factor 4 gamma 2 n=1 Tax=Exaiptasia diaphana TaxID=2652724 RepID=A0A913Y3F8_EXADI|nr:eukaryotic translation initiation factor 4 gamma 1 [Exaiptasia diaphana]